MRLAALVIICCALASSTASAGAMRLTARRLGSAVPFLVRSDGARFAAWPATDGKGTDVFDARSGLVRTVATPEKCEPTALGAGALVYTCEGAFTGIGTARLYDLRTGVVRQVVGDPTTRPGGFVPSRSFAAAGTHWVQAIKTDYHVSVSEFYSRASGEQYAGPSPFGPHVRPDLDRPGLRAPICSPLVARRIDESDEADGYLPPQIDGRFALDAIASGPRGQMTKLVLRHCGSRRRRVVCQPWCISPVLDRGRVLWADDFGRLHALGVRARHARTYVVPGHPVTVVDPLGHTLLLGTDALFGEARVQVRVVSARALGMR